MELTVIFAIGASIILYMVYESWKIKAVRAEVMQREFPEKFVGILDDNLPLYQKLPEEYKKELHGKILVFLEEKPFEGCGGLKITDEIKVTIAGQASMLLLNRKNEFYNLLTSVIVYPAAYVAKNMGYQSGQMVEEESVRLGESWNSGALVLAWHDVKRGTTNDRDGQNVVIHEFAHQLDQEDGSANGAPVLGSRAKYVSWAKVLGDEFKELKKKSSKYKKTTMDSYGATNPAEFFAVATETFFEKPIQMHQKHPELYEELKDYYRLDPLSWED
jgi:Mlc titration factor MtfA (ptsG expression regulator)